MDLILHFDGACEPNPGRGSWGWVLTKADGELLAEGSGVIAGQSTNNVAEYTALGMGLRHVADRLADLPGRGMEVYGDSNLVVCQVTGAWACNSPNLVVLRNRCRELALAIEAARGLVRFTWIPREENAAADALSVAAWEAAAGRTFPVRVKRARR